MGERTVIDINEIIMDMIRNPEIQVINIKYTENFKWGVRNLQGWKEQYGGKIVLILDKEVIFADEDIEKVRATLASFPISLRAQIVPFKILRKDEISFYG
jgi:hypothetical protein